MPNSKDSYHKHPHRDSSIETLIDFITDGASIGHGLDITELVAFEDELGEKNIDKIFQLYSSAEETTYSPVRNDLTATNADEIGRLPLKIGTELVLPLAKVDRELRKLDTNQVVDFRTFSQFMSAQLYYLMKDPKYQRTYKIQSSAKAHSIREIFNDLSVWVWSRNLSVDEKGEYSDVLLDITPFIKDITSSVSANGGNFSISLAGVTTEYVKNEGWVIDKNMKFTDDTFISGSGFYKQIKEQVLRNDYFFHNTLQENDVVFIRYEKLDIEPDRENPETLFQIPKSELAGKIFDMIGLIDSNTLSSSATNLDVTVSISGRDLSKLLIEDGVYFYPFDYVSDGIFGNEDAGDRLERYDGQLQSRFQLGFKTIDNTFKFIFNALSSIKITSDSLFDSYASSRDIEDLEYKDRRSRKFYASRNALVLQQKQIEDQNTNVREIKEIIERSVGFDGVPDPPSANAIYNSLKDFVEKLKKDGLAKEENGKFVGWENTTFEGVAIKADVMPTFFGNRLYRDKRVWRDGNGNVLTDQERLDFLKVLERSIANIQLKIKDNLLNRDQIESEEKIDAPEREETAEKSLNDFLIDAVEENNAIVGQRDQLPNDAQAATGGNLQSEAQIEQKLKINFLQAEIARLQAKGKSLKAIILPKKYGALNDFAREAMERIWSLLKQIETYNATVPKDELRLAKGIWQIFKILVDDNVRTRRIVDSSIGNEQGSLMNALRKVAQEPFVEMIFDTYGDQYYVTVRKPPFDKKGMISMLEDQDVLVGKLPSSTTFNVDDFTSIQTNPKAEPNPPLLSAAGESEDVTEPKTLTIDIDDNDIISDQLTYGLTNQIYSWYRLTPQNLIAGQANDMAFAYLKAIYFKEYADIWGSKPLDITTNYVPYFPVVDKNSKLPTAYFIKQGIIDLKFMIESNAYNPFIRSGTVTVIGSRLYKKGTFVRLKSTQEVFYVEGVSNATSISGSAVNRTTTLQLSRGMVEKYIKGIEINGINHSYFNIVNTDIDDRKFLEIDQGYSDSNKMLANWKVNPEVFYFFLKQKQFAHIANFIDLPSITDIKGP